MRLYSNIAVDTVLTSDPGVSGTTISGVDFTGWPSPSSGDTALACIDWGMANVELVEYISRTSTALTLHATAGRHVDGTSAGSHNVGASVRHVGSAADLQAFVRHGDAGLAAMETGQWYPPDGVTALTTVSNASGTLRTIQHSFPGRTHIVGIGVDVTVGVTATLRFGIWQDNGKGKPGALVLNCGSVAVGGTTGFKSPAAIDLYLPRGLYHAGLCAEVAAVTTRAASTHRPPARVYVPTTTTTTANSGWVASGITAGTLPDPFPAGSTSNTLPYILLQTA